MSTVTHQQAFQIAIDYHRAGRISEAEGIYRQLLAIYPQNPDLWQLLGVIAHQSGRLEEALNLLQRAIEANPNAAPYYNNLGLLLNKLGRREEAVTAFRKAIQLQPEVAESHYNLGITLCELGRPSEAVEVYQTALRLHPDHSSAQLNLGVALTMAGRMDEALAHYRSVLQREPGNVSITVNLGNLLKDLARLDEAVETYRLALRYAPDDFNALNNLGVALKDSGGIEASLDCIRRSLAVSPNRAEVHSNLIFTSFFHPSLPPSEIAAEMHRWSVTHEFPLRNERRPHSNDPSPDRRLRIGYVSPDFRDHVVGRTFLPCFEAHDREQFEFFCYSGASVSDDVTEHFRARADGWRETSYLSDAQLAEQIRTDRIDVLIDLALHTGFNRLLAFARKPAPVQLAWLGYPGATGLEAMDYRITDHYLDPLGEDRAGSFEETMRLPDAWCCYRPHDFSPDVSALPISSGQPVTFGSFNNFTKINPQVLELWAEILQTIDGSRLFLVLKGSGQDKTRRFFEERGISADRIKFLSYYATAVDEPGKSAPPEFLLRYHHIDIALDPFPYNGMTTTCDALWMGVPVVALIGETTLGRASYSLLCNVGLPELAAASEEDYVRIAIELARDLPRLQELRANLRKRMKNSPLLDAPRFARNLEAIFRQVWGRWCGTVKSNPSPPDEHIAAK
jgi:predicted O-linked N-acetylglucosamine transferase (SPINDLY family)